MKIPGELDQFRQFPEASIAVCAFDAGAASHLTAWLAPLQRQLRLFVSGPAENLFSQAWGSLPNSFYTLEEALEGAVYLISGTSWPNDLEHRARLIAKANGIPSAAVLDHWCFYERRFQRDGHEVLPDALWVSDTDAACLAKLVFPTVSVLQLPNQWLESLCNEVRSIRNRSSDDQVPHPRRPSRNLLYLLEPIRIPWSQAPAVASEAGEFQALRYFLKQLPHLINHGLVASSNELEELRLRPHPSEPTCKYDAFIEEVSRFWPICLDTSPGLVEALAWADMAFGCETQALVAAMACDIPSFSTLPPWAPPCCLPQASLQHLKLFANI